jgi:AcrR family transcriptional regulator
VARARQLRAGRHGLSPTFVKDHQRERLLSALAELVSEQGYANTTVEQIVQRSGCSRRTFYDHFVDKQAALFGALDSITDKARAAVAASFLPAAPWPDRVTNALSTLLEFVASEPAFARMAYVELPSTGPAGIARHAEAVASFELFLQPALATAKHPVPADIGQMIGASIAELMRETIVRGACEELPALLPSCVYICLLPFYGPERAAKHAGLTAPTRSISR